MSSTERPGERVRDAERTRRAVLEAAHRLVTTRGAGVSMADVAEAAGVTKGGLTHHFKSRDELLAGLVAHVVERSWEEVMGHVDITENGPGKFARAYVRALTGGSAAAMDVYSTTGLIAHLGAEVGLEHLESLAPDDSQRLNKAFEADGLPLPLAWVVRYAAEGLALSLGTRYLTESQLDVAREELLALTRLD